LAFAAPDPLKPAGPAGFGYLPVPFVIDRPMNGAAYEIKPARASGRGDPVAGFGFG
jgi:hypothetical protein